VRQAETRDSVLKFQLSEVQAAHEELESQMQDMKLANENLVYPELQRLRDSIMNIEKEARKAAEDIDKENAMKKRLLKLHDDLTTEVCQ
jgi:hypothetical protein